MSTLHPDLLANSSLVMMMRWRRLALPLNLKLGHNSFMEQREQNSRGGAEYYSSKSVLKKYIQTFLEELKKAFVIAKNMIGASKTTASLNNAYRDLGILLCDGLKKRELVWDHPKVGELLLTIERYNSDLLVFEEQVNRAKGGASRSSKA
ncbi:MAG: hypothetical protein HQK50_03830 [Oligoflexia bacterium]|nr:hypothetical protein [Oligoflexia bacterium]MBF0364674.1 hypothetical protein [Oligoflexia bacterium]